MNMKPTVVILLSDKRSGSTMFQKELCKHPLINHVDYSPHTYFETHHWLKAACLLELPHNLFSGHQRYPGYGSNSGARQYMIDCIQGNVPEFAVPADEQALVFEGWDALCGRFARPVFFEKSPQYLAQWAALTLMLRWIQNTHYQVRIIGLVRNPMSVLYSAHERFFTSPESRQFGWADIYRNLLSFKEMVGKDKFYLVRYEDLIAKPKKMFQEVCSFIGVDYDDKVGVDVHSSSLNKWSNDLTFAIQLHDSVKQMAKHFGYTDEEMYNPPKPGMSLSQKAKKHVIGTYKLTRAKLVDRIIKPLLLPLRRKKYSPPNTRKTRNG